MLEMVFWDVQHGNSTYIKTPGNKHIVIDLGVGSYIGRNTNFSPLLHLKKIYQISSIDEVIITHPHTDHIDDILNFDELNPKVLRIPSHLSENDIRNANPSSDAIKIDKYLEISRRYIFPVSDKDNPTLPSNNGGVSFKFFSTPNCGNSNINNHSIVTIIEYLGIKVTIPGDNESASWKELLQNQSFTNAVSGTNILLASHHGRESGYCSELFDYFSPNLVIISDGAAVETSVTDKYRNAASGWDVKKRSDASYIKRYCLTTRNDGTIVVKMWNENQTNYLDVSIE